MYITSSYGHLLRHLCCVLCSAIRSTCVHASHIALHRHCMARTSMRITVIASAAIVLAWLTVTLTEERKKKESQKIDDLPVLATRRSGTLAMLSSKVNGPVAYRSTRSCMERAFVIHGAGHRSAVL